MPTVCSKCRRVNPTDAAFCYYDGTLLNPQARNGLLAASRQPFPHPFTFPSGRRCRNFDELALACQENWNEARALLEQGLLESFFTGLGRADLTRAARAAARAPDRDRGLDELLEKLPAGVLLPPRVKVYPQEVHLGVLPFGTDQRFELHLENSGHRLLRGSITCEDTPWLVLGDGPGSPEKLFQFGHEAVIPVQVKGKRLRAGHKPLEGRLLVESNGGTVAVMVRVDVPVTPFPHGVLAGALTPRQIAEKAKDQPKEAAPHFEGGAVAQWYRDNGWAYPVQGPVASGVGAIQQFFEALGLTAPPKVEVSVRQVFLNGPVGDRLEYILEVTTQEKRPVYAYAGSDKPWLRIGKINLQGRVATIPLVVPAVPDRPGERLQATVTVTANGNQRFPVGVLLTVAGRADAVRAMPEPAARPVARPANATPIATPWEPPPAPAPPPRARPREEKPRAIPVAPPLRSGCLAHVVPLLLLFGTLLGIFGLDLFRQVPPAEPPPVVEEAIDPDPLIAVHFHDSDRDVVLGTEGVKPPPGQREGERRPATWEATMRFGVVMLRENDPKKPGKHKRLTFEEEGATNNTVLQLDRHEVIFGEQPYRLKENGQRVGADQRGHWKEGERDVPLPADAKKGEGRKSVWVYDQERVQVTQFVEIVPGEQSRKLDTCLVRYLIENNDRREHRVGLRFMLDTYIGANDGVPFTLPGESELCDTLKDFRRPQTVPDFIQALERDDLADPGTVAQVQFRLGERLEPPGRVTLGAWPNPVLRDRDARCLQDLTLWEVPLFPIRTLTPPDSAVVMYWDPKPLVPGAKRDVGFAYGLGNVASSEGAGRLGLSVGGRFVPGGEFTLTALVDRPLANESLALTLPDGLTLVEGQAIQPVPPPPPQATRRTSPVTWRIKAARSGKYTLKVESSAGPAQTQAVRIRTSSIFD
jgi:hypothetical protein